MISPLCVACQKYHGSIEVHLLCLGREVLALRAQLAPIRAAKAAYDALPCTPGGSVDEQRRAGRK